MTPKASDLVVTRWGARFHGCRFPSAIGRGGIAADKVEGDGVTPLGIWHLVGGAYRADRGSHPTGRSSSIIPIDRISALDIWSDDVADPDYNHRLRAVAHPFSHERLHHSDRVYDLVLFSDWNWPDAAPGKGSAIFIHAWRKPRHPTEGCIAFAPRHLRWIVRKWTPNSRVFVG